MTTQRWFAGAVFIIVVSHGLGCSFIAGVRTSPDAKGQRHCSAVPPVVDIGITLAAAALVASTAGGEQVHDDGGTKHVAFLYVGIPSLLVGITTAVSAIHGFTKLGACGDEQRRDATQRAMNTVVQGRFLQATQLARAGACTKAALVGEPLADLDRDVFHELRRVHSYRQCRDHLCTVDARSIWCVDEP